MTKLVLRRKHCRNEHAYPHLAAQFSAPYTRSEVSLELVSRSAVTKCGDHNVLGGFLDVRPAVFAAGRGHAAFRNFRYWPEVKSPV
jgi:hypothetical protein